MDEGRKVANLIIIRENQVLIVKRSERETSFPNCWSFPGGALEAGESFQEGLKREIREEIGCQVKNNELFKTVEFATDKGIINYYVGEVSGEIVLDNDELSDYRWISLEEDVSNLDWAFEQDKLLEEYRTKKE